MMQVLLCLKSAPVMVLTRWTKVSDALSMVSLMASLLGVPLSGAG